MLLKESKPSPNVTNFFRCQARPKSYVGRIRERLSQLVPKRLFDSVVLFALARIRIISCLRNKMHSATKVRIKKPPLCTTFRFQKQLPPDEIIISLLKMPNNHPKIYSMGQTWIECFCLSLPYYMSTCVGLLLLPHRPCCHFLIFFP